MLWLGGDYPQGGGGLAPVSSGPYKHDPPLICDGRMAAPGLGSVTADHILSQVTGHPVLSYLAHTVQTFMLRVKTLGGIKLESSSIPFSCLILHH